MCSCTHTNNSSFIYYLSFTTFISFLKANYVTFWVGTNFGIIFNLIFMIMITTTANVFSKYVLKVSFGKNILHF